MSLLIFELPSLSQLPNSSPNLKHLGILTSRFQVVECLIKIDIGTYILMGNSISYKKYNIEALMSKF